MKNANRHEIESFAEQRYFCFLPAFTKLTTPDARCLLQIAVACTVPNAASRCLCWKFLIRAHRNINNKKQNVGAKNRKK